jgi:uncharacterized tellurite resistance protein B-like protein
LLCICWFLYKAYNTVDDSQITRTIRRGSEAADARRLAAGLLALREADPMFDETTFLERAATAFTKLQAAWSVQDLSAVRPFISDGIHERFNLQFLEQKDAGYRNVMDQVRVMDRAIAEVRLEGGFDVATVRILADAIDYRASLANGKRVGGSSSSEAFVEYWSFLRRRGATTAFKPGLIEGHCPNCGTPIEMNAGAKCVSCGALLRSGQYDWVLAEITQDSEWSPADDDDGDGSDLPGIAALRAADPAFCLQDLEDRTSVMFWRKAMADRIGKSDPLRKVATDDFTQRYTAELQSATDAQSRARTFSGECAVGAVITLGVMPATAGDGDGQGPVMERAVVEVRWAGRPYVAKPGAPPHANGESALARSLFVLGRKPGVKTDADAAVSSAHCPQCGAPVTTDIANACQFCNTILNDGARGWVLLDIAGRSAPAGRALLSELEAHATTADAPPVQPAEMSDTAVAGFAPIPPPLPARPTVPVPPPLPTSRAGLLEWMTQAVVADGVVTDQERDLLTKAAARQRVSPEQLDAMITAASTGQLSLPSPRDRNEAEQWLTAMANVALADGKIQREEFNLLRSLGDRFGLSAKDVDLLIRQERGRMYDQAREQIRAARSGDGNGG